MPGHDKAAAKQKFIAFLEQKNLRVTAQRQAIIDRMIAVARDDVPWLWGFHPKDYSLYHGWLTNLRSVYIDTKIAAQATVIHR